jgi:hypothetical protein
LDRKGFMTRPEMLLKTNFIYLSKKRCKVDVFIINFQKFFS